MFLSLFLYIFIANIRHDVKQGITYDPETPLLGRHPKDWKQGPQQILTRPCS